MDIATVADLPLDKHLQRRPRHPRRGGRRRGRSRRLPALQHRRDDVGQPRQRRRGRPSRTTTPPRRPSTTTASSPPTAPAPASSPRPVRPGPSAAPWRPSRATSDVVAGLPSVGATVTLSSASPATFEAPGRHGGRPGGGGAVPDPHAARPRRRPLPGGLGDHRHAGRRGHPAAADARLDRQRHRRGRRHQGLPRRPGARRRPRRPDTRASRSSPRCRTCSSPSTRRPTPRSGWTIDVATATSAATFDADDEHRRRSPSRPPAAASPTSS